MSKLLLSNSTGEFFLCFRSVKHSVSIFTGGTSRSGQTELGLSLAASSQERYYHPHSWSTIAFQIFWDIKRYCRRDWITKFVEFNLPVTASSCQLSAVVNCRTSFESWIWHWVRSYRLSLWLFLFRFMLCCLSTVLRSCARIPGDSSLMTYRGHCVLNTLIRARFSPMFSTGQQYIYTGCASGAVVGQF